MTGCLCGDEALPITNDASEKERCASRDLPALFFCFIGPSRQNGGGMEIQSGKQLALLASLLCDIKSHSN